ncbi:MAG: 4-hydroxy-tetrahydrodipicolinate synthase [Clostridiaceae bacterium]|nr:4-hydroxy-tetrahydrodipicolinate synthase [Clostridiaceae bacterium]
MRRPIFTGAGVAIVTPFAEDGPNYEVLAQLCEWQIDSGTDAIIITGTTGEASTMPDAEHVDVIRECCNIVAGRLPVIAGTGSNDTAHAVNLARMAEAAGADALLCVTPYYNKATQDGLIQHFGATAESVDIPIILYNVPSRTNLNINPETYLALAEYENIIGIKECNIHQVAKTQALCGDAYDIYSGEDGLIIPLMSLGGKGVISVAANIIPGRIANMVHNWFDGNYEQAQQEQIDLIHLIDILFCEVNPIPVKTALRLMGYNVGSCRLPLSELSPTNKSKLAYMLHEYGII